MFYILFFTKFIANVVDIGSAQCFLDSVQVALLLLLCQFGQKLSHSQSHIRREVSGTAGFLPLGVGDANAFLWQCL